MIGMGLPEVLTVCVIGLIGLAIPAALLGGLLWLHVRVKRIEAQLNQHD